MLQAPAAVHGGLIFLFIVRRRSTPGSTRGRIRGSAKINLFSFAVTMNKSTFCSLLIVDSFCNEKSLHFLNASDKSLSLALTWPFSHRSICTAGLYTIRSTETPME